VRKGYTRSELLSKIKLKSGGTLSKTLSELEASGFIEKYLPYKGNKDALYRLTDEYSLFYIKFIEKSNASTSDNWLKIRTSNSYKVWTGFTFETICIKHIEEIKEGLKIRGIYSANGSWVSKRKDNNTQIDLLIDRDDQVINLCEMKFSNQTFTIDKRTTENMIEKINVFKTETKTNKSIFLTFITTFGLKKNSYSNQIVQNELSMNALFTPL
jgi:DNA-binding transcriptional ArsR family regulator